MTGDPFLFAVVPTHNRRRDYRDCIDAILPQVDAVITVSHDAEYAPQRTHTNYMDHFVVPYNEYPPNISRMWNLGLRKVSELVGWADPLEWVGGIHDGAFVAILNDDCIVPPGWMIQVTEAMIAKGAVLGGPPSEFGHEIAGYAHVLDLRSGLRYDEQFQWWYGDTDMVVQAERNGGIISIPEATVEHRHPNSTTTGVLAEIAAADRLRFEAKYA